MRDLALVLAGVIAGGAINLGVQLALERRRRKRDLRLAVRVLYNELTEYGNLEINGGPLDASHLHQAWREHRADLLDLGAKEWVAVEEAVSNAVFPEVYPQVPASSNGSLEHALWLLEPHAELSEQMPGSW